MLVPLPPHRMATGITGGIKAPQSSASDLTTSAGAPASSTPSGCSPRTTAPAATWLSAPTCDPGVSTALAYTTVLAPTITGAVAVASGVESTSVTRSAMTTRSAITTRSVASSTQPYLMKE